MSARETAEPSRPVTCRNVRVLGALFFTFVASLLLTGCVERKLVIRSEPEGALVYLDEEFRGVTPLEVPFTYYADPQIELRKPGFEAQRFLYDLRAPFYQWVPLDLFFEVVYPFTIVDERKIERTLRPAEPVLYADEATQEALLERAQETRDLLGDPEVDTPSPPSQVDESR